MRQCGVGARRGGIKQSHLGYIEGGFVDDFYHKVKRIVGADGLVLPELHKGPRVIEFALSFLFFFRNLAVPSCVDKIKKEGTL